MCGHDQVFTMDQNWRSRWSRIGVHHQQNTQVHETMDFIELYRDDLLIDIDLNTKDTDIVFPSIRKSNDGSIKLSKVSINRLLEDSEYSPHALRRYALTELAVVLYQIEKEKLKTKNGEKEKIDERYITNLLINQAGHESDKTTLKFYIDTARARCSVSNPETQENLRSLAYRAQQKAARILTILEDSK